MTTPTTDPKPATLTEEQKARVFRVALREVDLNRQHQLERTAGRLPQTPDEQANAKLA